MDFLREIINDIDNSCQWDTAKLSKSLGKCRWIDRITKIPVAVYYSPTKEGIVL